jgi:hypothetical protein
MATTTTASSSHIAVVDMIAFPPNFNIAGLFRFKAPPEF